MKLLSPAKINLCLYITGRRDNGYHDLSMIMEKLSLFDEIELEKTDGEITVSTPIAGVLLEKDLTYRAAWGLKKAGGVKAGVRIQVAKTIPMGGGLGGGSSNAAIVLKGLNELWGFHWPTEKLADIGVNLGADIPFFLYDGPCKVEGIGDQVTPLKGLPKLWIILVNPGIPIATPWAYQTWDQAGQKELTQENQSVSVPSDFGALVQNLHNDFEEVILPKYPEISRVKESLLQVGADGALMSGSGSTVFGIFEEKETRDRAFEKIERRAGWAYYTAENGK